MMKNKLTKKERKKLIREIDEKIKRRTEVIGTKPFFVRTDKIETLRQYWSVLNNWDDRIWKLRQIYDVRLYPEIASRYNEKDQQRAWTLHFAMLFRWDEFRVKYQYKFYPKLH